MDKDALGSSKSKSQQKKKSEPSSVSASPLIFILAIMTIIVIGLIYFKDRLFKNNTKDLRELADRKKEESAKESETKTETKPETLSDNEAEKVNDKFAKLN